MKATKIVTPASVLLGIALLFLVPVCASAQTLATGWYRVKADEMSVRDNKNGLVMGTLIKGRGDRFYIRYVDAKTKNAWGVAAGHSFEGCGWVVTRYRTPKGVRGSTLERDANQTGSLPSCRTGENTNRRVERKYFAERFPNSATYTNRNGAAYTNNTPTTGDGSGAYMMPGSDFVYGNYILGGGSTPERDKLNDSRKLPTKPKIYWRYFTRDRRFVMVRYGGTGLRGSGLWGFVRCSMVRPDPSDTRDKAKFDKLCDRTP